jgi:hypothetical protein
MSNSEDYFELRHNWGDISLSTLASLTYLNVQSISSVALLSLPNPLLLTHLRVDDLIDYERDSEVKRDPDSNLPGPMDSHVLAVWSSSLCRFGGLIALQLGGDAGKLTRVQLTLLLQSLNSLVLKELNCSIVVPLPEVWGPPNAMSVRRRIPQPALPQVMLPPSTHPCITHVRYGRSNTMIGDLRWMSFPALTALELHCFSDNWPQLLGQFAPQLRDLTLHQVDFINETNGKASDVIESVAACTNLTSLCINDCDEDGWNIRAWKHLLLRRFMSHMEWR